jgi:hypothetical protein
MAKLFIKTSDDVYGFINNVWQNTGCAKVGVNLKVISTPKAKQVLKLSKASAITESLIHEEDVITLVVYEEAWDMLSELNKLLLIKGIFSLVSYDMDHDKVVIDNRPYADLFNMRHSIDENGKEYLDIYDNTLETASMVIQQIEDEERQRKEEEKERKRLEKEAKKAAKQK